MVVEGTNKPPLLAMLLCEQALRDEDGVTSLLRVIDDFTFSAQVSGLTPEQLGRIGFTLRCIVYTKWGLGAGQFTQELALVHPDGSEATPRQPTQFTKPEGFHFHQVRTQANIAIHEPGTYMFRVYLDGNLAGEHPFRVNIQRVRVEDSQPDQPES